MCFISSTRPSIGLHQRDNVRLINSLKELRDTGNSVVVVEHDKDMMLNADYVIDMGPKAGRLGGEVVYEGTPQEMLKVNTLTSAYLNGETEITIPTERRKGNGKFITIKGASGNNLKNVNATFPLGTLICVTGVSGERQIDVDQPYPATDPEPAFLSFVGRSVAL